MSIIRTTMRAATKRPSLPVFIGILMLATAIFNTFIPVMATITGVLGMTGGNIFESMLSVLQMLIDSDILLTLLMMLVVVTILVAIIAGLLLPGFLLAAVDSIATGAKKQGLFIEGVKHHFFRFFFMTVKTVLFTAFFALFLMVSLIPAIIVTRMAVTARSELMIAALFIDFMTAGVIFMCLSFYKAYIYMWYIAASTGEEKPFSKGKSIADRQFWDLTLKLLIFDIVFVAGMISSTYLIKNQIYRYILGWTFSTAFFTTLAVYLVQTFRDGARKLSNSVNPQKVRR